MDTGRAIAFALAGAHAMIGTVASQPLKATFVVVRASDRGGTPARERAWSECPWDVVAAARLASVAVPVGLLEQILGARENAHTRER